MGEFNIQKPCVNCELADLLDDENGLKLLVIEGLYMAVGEKNILIKCRHPWRLLYQTFNENPNPSQAELLSKVVEVRGKDPEEYGLPKVNNISTLDI